MGKREIIETERTIDLHIHTKLSGGTSTPTEIVQEAKEKGLSAIAITDHYLMSGVKEAIIAARQDIEVIPGVEIPTKFDVSNGKEKPSYIHLLGLFVEHNRQLVSTLEKQRKAAIEKDKERIKKLNSLKKGYNLNYNDLLSYLKRPFLGEYYIVQYLFEKGLVNTMNEGRVLLEKGGAAYIESTNEPTVQYYINLIHQAGGLAVLAHPIVYWLSFMKLEEMIKSMKDLGLDGIETYHSDNTEYTHQCMVKLAKEYDLCESGGSDYHGTNNKFELGTCIEGKSCVPYSILEELRKRKSQKFEK